MRFYPQILLLFFVFLGNKAFGQIPITLPDSETTAEDTPVAVNVLANDTDLLDTIDPATVDLDPGTAGLQQTSVVAGKGTFTVDATGIVTFTPDLNFFGTASNNYTVDNSSGVTSLPTTVTITVTSVNDPPVAVDDATNTIEDTPVSGKVTDNDTDVDGTIDKSTVDLDPTLAGQQTTFTTASGTFVAGVGGKVTFTPALNFSGTATCNYTVNDNDGATSNVATITVTVDPVNDPPTAVDDAATTLEDTPVSFKITANDTDVDGSVDDSSVDLDPSLAGQQTTNTTAQGVFVYDNAGSVTFTPALNVNGSTSIQYTVNDDLGATSAPAAITVTITAVNDPPLANDDAISSNEGVTAILNVVTNDTDPENNISASTVDLNVSVAGIQSTNTTPAGSWSVNATGQVSFTPIVGFNGNATLTYTVNDTAGATSNAATITITVNAVNDPPNAVDDTATTAEDNSTTISILANDSDPDNAIDPTTVDLNVSTGGIQSSNVTANGTFTVNTSGVVSFTPTLNFHGTATVQYNVADVSGATSNNATITVTVTDVNDPPVAQADATTTAEDTPVSLNVVSNDTDVDGTINAATVDLDASTAGIQNSITTAAGTFTVNAAGVVTFTPVLNYSGSATTSYTVNDEDGATSNQATIAITVTPVNDAPVAVNDATTTAEETPVSLNVVTNDTDIDGTVNAATVDLNPAVSGIQTTITIAAGVFAVNASGVVTYTPAINFSGTASVTYTVNDNGGATSNIATITITVTAVNKPPVAVNDATTTPEDTPTSINVVNNDTDPDGSINVASVDLNTTLAGIQTTNSNASGSFSVNASGVVSYTPTLNFFGSATLNYTVNDDAGATSNIATITITVTSVNDAPVAVNDATTTVEETPVTLNVVTNDTDIDGTINTGSVDLNTGVAGIQNTMTIAAGTFKVNGAGVVTFTPAVDFNGTASITYTVNDNNGATSNQATISVEVTPINDPPVAVNDATSTNEDTPVTVNVVSNDTDPDGTVNAASVDLNTTTAGIQNTNTTASGAYSVDASGVVTFTPALNFNGSAVLHYTVNDDGGATSNVATLTITVNAVNDAPVAVNDAASTNEGSPVNVNVITNDTDVDGTVVASTVDLNPSVVGIQTSITIAAGTFSVSSGGMVTFTPVANFNGTATTTYTVNDNSGATSNAATITITVNSVNDPPVANNDNTSTNEDTPVTIDVVANDTDIDGTINATTVDLNVATVGIQSSNTNAAGSWSVNSSGVVTYTPTLNFNGTATLTYRVNDNDGGTSNNATISIVVNPVNDPPVANNDAITTNEDTPVTLNVVANDTDVDGTINKATVDLNTSVAGIQTTATISGGTVSVSALGVVTFTPTINFYGIATTTYFVNDNSGATSDAGTITFTVTSVNDPPIANNDITSANENEVVTINVVANDLDVDGTVNAATVDLNPAAGGIQTSRNVTGGTFSVNSSGVVTYTPTTNFNGIATVTYTVQDDAGGTSNAATITVTVNSVNSDPLAANDAVSTNEDTPASVNVVSNDSDPDGTINASTVDLNTATAGIQNSITVTEGTFTVNASGVVSYTPTANFNGTVSITYTVNDNVGATSNVATITVTVISVNDLPVANGDAATTLEDTPVTVNVIANDTDVDGTIDGSSVDLNTTTAGIQNSNTTAAGSWSVNATGVVTFTPTSSFNGTATLSYKVNDNSGGTSSAATITITVTPVNDPPVAVNDAATTNEDTPVNINVVSNDTDEDGTVNAASVDLNTTLAGIQNSNTITEGTFTVNAAGLVTYTPALNFNGTVSITYTVNDNGGLTSNVATISITVNAVNDAPVAVNDVLTTLEDQSATVNVVTNDTDVDGTINAATVDLNTTLAGIQNSNTTTAGSFTVNTLGVVTFTPNANYSGSTSLGYRVNDNNGLTSNIATIAVTITEVNDPPVFAAIDTVKVFKNSGVKTVNVTGISPGPNESEALLLTATSGNTTVVPNPTVTYNGTGTTATLTFTPIAGNAGSADITVKLVDTGLNEYTQTFTVDVIEVKIISTPGTVASIGNPYTYPIKLQVTPDREKNYVGSMVSVPTKPTWLNLSATRDTLKGIPPANATASNPVKVQVRSKAGLGSVLLDEQNYTLTINAPPTVSAFNVAAEEDVARPFTVQEFQAAFSDPNADVLSKIKIVSLPKLGTLRLNSVAIAAGQEIVASSIPNLTYLSLPDTSGSDVFSWMGNDGYTYSLASADVTVTLTPVNDPPVITNLETSVVEYDQGANTPIVITTAFDAKDIDDATLSSAQIGFRPTNFKPANDRLIFSDTEKILGSYDETNGILTLTGTATVAEYVQAVRTVNYSFINFKGIADETKTVYFTLSDGKAQSEAKERSLKLVYNFEELRIPSAFTPDGNGRNDTWEIDAGTAGSDKYNNAVIKIYNGRGMLVYETTGLSNPWDGTLNGSVLPADTYYYTIDLKYNSITYKGIVTILR